MSTYAFCTSRGLSATKAILFSQPLLLSLLVLLLGVTQVVEAVPGELVWYPFKGNLQDAKMHKLADKGNGAYHYIDSIFEAKKVLIDEMGATLQTIAKDVKIQVEFNPAHVAAYQLVGYETRLLAAEDFADDKKDAGELGAGHTVTALYEIIPRGAKSPELDGLDIPLKYQRQDLSDEAEDSGELLTVKLRYKEPEGDVSKLITQVIAADAVDGEPPQIPEASTQRPQLPILKAFVHHLPVNHVGYDGPPRKGFRLPGAGAPSDTSAPTAHKARVLFQPKAYSCEPTRRGAAYIDQVFASIIFRAECLK